MSYVFEYVCPKCQHEGISTSLKFGYYCPKCDTDVPGTIRRTNLVNSAIRQNNMHMMLISYEMPMIPKGVPS